MLKALCDATIFTGEAMVEGHALLINNHKIIDIVANGKVPLDIEKCTYNGQILAPGFIDLQVNGGGNVQLNNQPTAEACIAIAKAHADYGTTSLLPTVISDTPDITRQSIAAVREARKTCPHILGIHIEGPHLGIERRGIHQADNLRPLTDQDMELYRPENDEVMLITLAPEITSPEQIKILRQRGVVIALGHTSATSEQIRHALAAGAAGFTHLFNGMGGLSARSPGPAGIALDDRDSWCGLIVDDHHVSPEMIRLALRAKPPGKVFLVSDAMAPAATQHPEPFLLYGTQIAVKDGACMNAENRLAGSAITMSDAVQNCIQKIGIDIEEALRMASTYPAEFIGHGKHLGKLLPGYTANIISLNAALHVQPCNV